MLGGFYPLWRPFPVSILSPFEGLD